MDVFPPHSLSTPVKPFSNPTVAYLPLLHLTVLIVLAVRRMYFDLHYKTQQKIP